ncbi:glycine cleavage system protein GcvH [Cuneatibacter sp. NSJ-177]|uniref:glycine cleavage system protein GcvH n=1 Tax=Cuneatibacter sp. NSJ-177 TaxID=2931401 RepID=UPI001FD06428|nr:glycine cleavage system protein GcvH [Cuneatibacter sp. NSJ-177]MCJ7836278.1 glycine cleavage system protein GcvH [Cuneatibacter sp. NSJ-177]
MQYPAELKYVKSHEWIRMEGDTAVIGISDYAQDALGDLVFVNLPEAGDSVTLGEAFGDVESVKAVSDVISPVTGVVKEINEDLLENPQRINEAPYEAWFIKVGEITEEEEYLTAEAYEAFAAEEAEG